MSADEFKVRARVRNFGFWVQIDGELSGLGGGWNIRFTRASVASCGFRAKAFR